MIILELKEREDLFKYLVKIGRRFEGLEFKVGLY